MGRQSYETKTLLAITNLTRLADELRVQQLVDEVERITDALGEKRGPYILHVVPRVLAQLSRRRLITVKRPHQSVVLDHRIQLTASGIKRFRMVENLTRGEDISKHVKTVKAMLQPADQSTKRVLQETNQTLAETIEDQQNTIMSYKQKDKERLLRGDFYASPTRTTISPLRKAVSMPAAAYDSPRRSPALLFGGLGHGGSWPTPPQSPTRNPVDFMPIDEVEEEDDGDVPMDDIIQPDFSVAAQNDKVEMSYMETCRELEHYKREWQAAMEKIAQQDIRLDEAKDNIDTLGGLLTQRSDNLRVTNEILAAREDDVDRLSAENEELQQDIEDAERVNQMLSLDWADATIQVKESQDKIAELERKIIQLEEDKKNKIRLLSANFDEILRAQMA
ncbi:hypothetical protein MIND_01392700 [Mycena indigotica]|uniref:Uncharacterized protein n=1 Tax=Mycena indigotica TaxID=2126181 RepID=A0A8H6VTB5_9AGAR|nr:uncharacterized protein MIND_01392700 [Mycena indigotica]KAF7289308.1 hypothetical protein MIND_01392700 [Mycena indigotica]